MSKENRADKFGQMDRQMSRETWR